MESWVQKLLLSMYCYIFLHVFSANSTPHNNSNTNVTKFITKDDLESRWCGYGFWFKRLKVKVARVESGCRWVFEYTLVH